jgi:hypothetical protein
MEREMIETLDILNDGELLEIREYHMERLGELFAGVHEKNEVFVLNGICSNTDMAPDYDIGTFVAGQANYLVERAEDGLNQRVFRPLVFESWLCGVHLTTRSWGCTPVEV